MTMTTVGYGDMVASTAIGRKIAILTIVSGAYIITLIIAVQSSLFQMTKESQKNLNNMAEQKAALRAICAAMRYQVARVRRYRQDYDYIPSVEELEELRQNMIDKANKFRAIRLDVASFDDNTSKEL